MGAIGRYIHSFLLDAIRLKKQGTYGIESVARPLIHTNIVMGMTVLWTAIMTHIASQQALSLVMSLDSINREVFHLFGVVGLDLKPAARPIFHQAERILVYDNGRREPEFRRSLAQVPHKDELLALARSKADIEEAEWVRLNRLYLCGAAPVLIHDQLSRMRSSASEPMLRHIEGIETRFRVDAIDYSGVDLTCMRER